MVGAKATITGTGSSVWPLSEQPTAKLNCIIITSSLLLIFTLSRAGCKRVYSVSTTINKMFWQPGGNEVFDQLANLFVSCDFRKSLGSVLQCSIAVPDKCLPKQEKQLTGWVMFIRGLYEQKQKRPKPLCLSERGRSYFLPFFVFFSGSAGVSSLSGVW